MQLVNPLKFPFFPPSWCLQRRDRKSTAVEFQKSKMYRFQVYIPVRLSHVTNGSRITPLMSEILSFSLAEGALQEEVLWNW